MQKYVLDTSALLAFRDNEEGAGEVEKILRQASSDKCQVFASFMSFMELFYCVWRVEGKGAAHRAYLELKMLPVQRVDLQESLLFLAGEIKATYPLSVADSWIAATALEQQAVLVHKDPEFEPLADRITLQVLPYKS